MKESEKKKAEQIFHTHPKHKPPRYDLRKLRVLKDEDLEEKDEDIIEEDEDLKME